MARHDICTDALERRAWFVPTRITEAERASGIAARTFRLRTVNGSLRTPPAGRYRPRVLGDLSRRSREAAEVDVRLR
jgi:hypothetical protein